MFFRKQRSVLVESYESDPTPPSVSLVLDQYIRSAPDPQHAVDLFAGEWSSSFPPVSGVVAGNVPLFEDPRIAWTIEVVGGIEGWRVLELGPLEAGHTTMLHQAGADIVAVEANSRAYLKCLIVKELMDLRRAQFLLGDFLSYLQSTEDRYDLAIASGVLYHSPDPLALLESLAKVTNRLAIWTHFFESDAINADHNNKRMFAPEQETLVWNGMTVELHRRKYRESLEWSGFCGGPEDSAVWLERETLISALRALGFGRIEVMSEDLNHVNGPCIMLYTERVS